MKKKKKSKIKKTEPSSKDMTVEEFRKKMKALNLSKSKDEVDYGQITVDALNRAKFD